MKQAASSLQTSSKGSREPCFGANVAGMSGGRRATARPSEKITVCTGTARWLSRPRAALAGAKGRSNERDFHRHKEEGAGKMTF